MNYKLKISIVPATVIIALSFFSMAQAATLSVLPVSSEIGIGEKITVELRVDGEGISFNAAQTSIRFPTNVLQVVSLDKTSSAFNFWLEEPQFSNSEGIISLTGGTPYGVSGNAVEILKIEFVAKGSGNGTISLTGSAVTAADGSGTNILSKTNDAVISVVPKRTTPETPSFQPSVQQITRQPIPASNLPLKPVLNIPLYPETDRWYGLIGQFTASWDLPLDISGVSTVLDKSPNTVATAQSEGLFDSKSFSALGDGVWYMHIRFRNNIGWGPTAHYKIAIDTKPPSGFEVNVLEGNKTDNPAPTLQFETQDALSGLKEYQIRLDNGDIIHILPTDFIGSFTSPLQTPGLKKILVKAVDLAGNSVENNVEIEILPIPSPSITFVPKELFLEDTQVLVLRGTALPGINILLSIQKVSPKGAGEIVAKDIVKADDKGNWEFTFSNLPLRNGHYVVLVQSQDARGALSLVIKSEEINVKSKPIIQFGAFQLGTGGAALFLLLLLIGGFGGGAWFYKKRQEKLALRVVFAESEITKIFKLVAEDVERISGSLGVPLSSDGAYTLKRLQENIQKMESYLKKGVEKINR